MSRDVRKPDFCTCENKDADQLRGYREADQHLCFRYTDSTIPVLPNPKYQVPSDLQWLPSPVCVGPGRKPRRPVFSERDSYHRFPTVSRGIRRNFRIQFFSIFLHRLSQQMKIAIFDEWCTRAFIVLPSGLHVKPKAFDAWTEVFEGDIIILIENYFTDILTEWNGTKG